MASSSRASLACDCRFDLVMSCFVTEERWDSSEWQPGHPVYEVRHRYSRFDVLVYSLRTYAALPLEHVYLYIELDEMFASRRDELHELARALFGNRLQSFQPRRLTLQREWRDELAKTISPATRGAVGDQGERLVWFLQNDDHPFVDVDTDVLCEGLGRMRGDGARFKSLYMSHWASALALSGKVQPPQRKGSYLVSRLTMLDSVQVLNYRYLHHLLSALDWKGQAFKRVDMMIRQRQIYDTREAGPKAHLARLFATDESLQAFYVPLRELCRKFDAYMEFGISVNVTRPLVLPPRANVATGSLSRAPPRLVQMLTAPGRVLWTMDNPFRFPRQWADAALRLYSHAGERHPARRRVCANLSHPLLALFEGAAARAAATSKAAAAGYGGSAPPAARPACAAALAAAAGRQTCGARIEQLLRVSRGRYSRKQAELKVGSDWPRACGGCGPCDGPCDVPAVHVLDDSLAGSEPMEALRAWPRPRLTRRGQAQRSGFVILQ